MRYIDGFVLPVPKKNMNAYVQMAKKAGKIWRNMARLNIENVSETIVKWSAFPAWPSQSGRLPCFHGRLQVAHNRDHVNAKVIKDPRLKGIARAIYAFRHETDGLWRI
jgi:uncharacterized protein YbaA (DUF1428 family)